MRSHESESSESLSGTLAGALAEALRSQGVSAPDLSPVGKPFVTGRSTLHRFTDRASGETYIVKRPVLVNGWVDTEAVMPPSAQFEALERAYRWQSEEDRHAVVRPVALLPAHDAFAMAWVSGPTVLQAIHRSPVDQRTARSSVRAAGDFLRRFHRHGRAPAVEVELGDLVREILEMAAGPLQEAGAELPAPLSAALANLEDRTVTQAQALLHGDYVPSNLVVRVRGEVVMLDPLLAHVGPRVDDVARFLAVLSSDSVFLPGLFLAPVRRLRRTLEMEFRTAYGIGETSQLLELRLLKQHLLRWLRRREHSRLRGVPPLMSARRQLIDGHMRGLLLESAARLAGVPSGSALPPAPSGEPPV